MVLLIKVKFMSSINNFVLVTLMQVGQTPPIGEWQWNKVIFIILIKLKTCLYAKTLSHNFHHTSFKINLIIVNLQISQRIY